jgi:pyruvate dehydrogenase E2 component (dihydrolipoamide acetyltransferase)
MSAARPFRLPDLGEGLQQAEIVAWLVAEGDEVAAGQAIATVETDKAQVDVTSPWTGRVIRLAAAVGDMLSIGDVLVEVELEAAQGEPARAVEREDAGTVVGELPQAPAAGGVRAAPAARARAQELGIDLASVAATGPGGSVTRADVDRAAASGSVGAAGADVPEGLFEPLRGVRLAMAHNMARSRAAVVPATVHDEADLGAWSGEADVTVRMVRAVVSACAAEPALNAWLEEQASGRRLHESVHLALAVQTPDGLFAPVLRNADGLEPSELRKAIDSLHEAVRARTLEPADLRGATITLSNFGRFGGRHAVLVVVPPQVAILGAGRIEPRVVVQDAQPAVRRTLPLSLTFDHRAVTGAEAARFLAECVADLERPD